MNDAATKTALREHLKGLRAELAARYPDAGEDIAEKFPLKLLSRYGPNVSAYWPIGSEIDPRALIARLRHNGAQIALPRVEDDGTMTFRAWKKGGELEARRFGLLEPSPSALQIAPTLVIAPLLGFDRTGHRLGYGKGHYDRAITALRQSGRVFVCGIAFEEQEVVALPAEPHDVPLDWVVTPQGSIPLFMMRNLTQLRS